MCNRLLLVFTCFLCYVNIVKSQDLLPDTYLELSYDPLEQKVLDLKFNIIKMGEPETPAFAAHVYLVNVERKTELYLLWKSGNFGGFGKGDGLGAIQVHLQQISLKSVKGLKSGTYRISARVDVNNTVKETDENNNYGVLGASYQTISYSAPVGIEEHEAGQQFMKLISANPVQNTLALAFAEGIAASPVQLFIVDVQGRVVLQQQLQHVADRRRHEIDIQHFPRGIYFLQIRTTSGTQQIKLVKN